jgi:co-chaperonin GroES (HSP10)
MNIKPLADRVLILPAPAEEQLVVSLSLIQQKKNL